MSGKCQPVDDEVARAAFAARDRRMDGRFIIGVKTTGIYCRPSCPARRPHPDNIVIFPDAAAAQLGGYRPCLRCQPDHVAPDREAVRTALVLLENGGDGMSLGQLADRVGYAPYHFARIFKRDVGVSPSAYARGLRARTLTAALAKHERITDAIYDAGYEAPSRAYADVQARMGMTPSAWKRGGDGVTIRYALVPSTLGTLLVAATEKGVCRISFDEDEAALVACFPRATIEPGGEAFADLASEVVGLVDDPGRAIDLPIDVAGTAFQESIWAALRTIPAGETRSYAQLAQMVGKPGAARAAGSACGDNVLALLIPCHRVLRSNGDLGGYAYGLERKEALLKREKVTPAKTDGSR